jgi:hypothetical protein
MVGGGGTRPGGTAGSEGTVCTYAIEYEYIPFIGTVPVLVYCCFSSTTGTWACVRVS